MLITTYNINFLIILKKFINIRLFLPFNFQLATYLNFTISQKLLAKINILVILKIIEELKDVCQILYDSIVLSTYFIAVTFSKSCSRENIFSKSYRYSFYLNK